MKYTSVVAVFAAVMIQAGCSEKPLIDVSLTLATTTSTRDSGLLDVLIPMFEEQTGIEVKVVAVGSGQALELGRSGDVDILLTHAPAAEQQFVDEGYGERRQPVMYNDFVLVGPGTDPAHASGETSISTAFRRVSETKSPFVSRGDDSGTHMREQAIWGASEVAAEGEWYIRSGVGMAEALRIASEMEAYTLSDRATFLAQRAANELTIISEGDPLLQNPYAAIVVSAVKHPYVHRDAAERFVAFLLEPKTQTTISEFGVQQYEQPLFFVFRSDQSREE